MQTDQEAAPEEKPVESKPEKPKESRKEFLLRKKAKNHDHLPPALQEELDEILAQEKAEHDHAALVHKLVSSADTWGRKEINTIKREVTDRVRVFGSKDSEETKKQLQVYQRAKKEIEQKAKREMQDVQERLNAALAKLRSENDEAVAQIREKYHGQYRVAEAEITERVDRTLSLVADFTAVVPSLTLEQLEELSSTGILQVGEGDFLVTPGAERPEKV